MAIFTLSSCIRGITQAIGLFSLIFADRTESRTKLCRKVGLHINFSSCHRFFFPYIYIYTNHPNTLILFVIDRMSLYTSKCKCNNIQIWYSRHAGTRNFAQTLDEQPDMESTLCICREGALFPLQSKKRTSLCRNSVECQLGCPGTPCDRENVLFRSYFPDKEILILGWKRRCVTERGEEGRRGR